MVILVKIRKNAQRESHSQSCSVKPNLDCNYTFPINLASNAIPFGANQSDKCNYNPNLLLFNYIENSSCTVIKEQPIPSY